MRKPFFLFCITLFSFLWCNQTIHAVTNNREHYEKTGHVFWDIKTKEKLVALTFDDGPDPVYTPQILDILAKYDAKATFFVIGEEAKKYPYIIKRQVKEGHEVANHTYHHNFNDNFAAGKLKKELEKTSKIIHSITGYKPSLFRPIAGYYNDQIVNTAINSGYQVILWSWHQDTKDWRRPGVNKITYNVVSDTRSGDIVIFHDSGGDRTQTVKAVEKIMDILYKEGFECVTVSEMLFRSQSIVPYPFK